MAITLSSSTANNADWKTQFQFTDADTGDLIDFTGATIEVEVRDFDGCLRIEATTDNGLITIQSAGIFEVDVPAETMTDLCPGTYQIGGVYSLNDETISLFTGSLAIISGVARL
jgi:hypothetical protein